MSRLAGLERAARRVAGSAVEALFPSRCQGCGRSGSFLCPACAGSLTPAAPPRCRRCWRPGRFTERCPHCVATPPAFDGLRAAFVYQGVARDLVHALKFRAITAVAPTMAALLAEAARPLPVDAIVPVPLSGLRRRTRGYNQAQLLARELAHRLGLPLLSGSLDRRRHTPPQAARPGAETRRRNVRGAFSARPAHVAGRHLLLVDDVTTTGATFEACAAALKEAGAGSVWALAFARED